MTSVNFVLLFIFVSAFVFSAISGLPNDDAVDTALETAVDTELVTSALEDVIPTTPNTTEAPDVRTQCHNAVPNGTSKEIGCSQCVKAAQGQCYYCALTSRCEPYFTKNIFHTPEECSYTKAFIWTCEINLQVMAISLMSVAGVILTLILFCCCYCCCCKRSEGTTRWQKELKRLERDRQMRKQQAEERKKEREARYEEIRRKYGLNDMKQYKRMS